MSDAGSDSSFDELFLASFECLSDRGWREYRFDISRAMHEAQLHGQRYVRFERDGIPYVADLERMVQTRADGVYRTERPVRDRIEFEHDPERAEGLPWRREKECLTAAGDMFAAATSCSLSSAKGLPRAHASIKSISSLAASSVKLAEYLASQLQREALTQASTSPRSTST
jgi:phytoene dehydrogenase-like protein